MSLPKHRLPLLALSLPFYGILAFGAGIYGSYRDEPSGVQYAFLPGLAAPACTALAFALLVAGYRAGVSRALHALPFVGAFVLALPGIGMSLANRHLEVARWVTIAVGVIHAIALIAHMRPRRSG